MKDTSCIILLSLAPACHTVSDTVSTQISFYLTVTVLTDDDLPVLQTKLDEVAFQWHTIGIQLGFKPGVLSGIESVVRGNVQSGLKELLTRWLQRKQPPSTLQSLIDVVRGEVIAHQVLAERLQINCDDFPTISKTKCNCGLDIKMNTIIIIANREI